MSVESMASVLHHSRAKGTAKLVLVGIANHDGDGGAWPAISTLMVYGGFVDRSTVKRAIRGLVKLGEVRVHLQAGGPRDMEDHDRPNRYDVLVECPEGCDRTTKHKARKGWKREPDGTYVRTDTEDSPLWITGGGTDAPGGGGAPPPGASTRPEPSINQPTPTNDDESVTGPRARGVGDTPPCRLCSAPNLTVCRERDAKVRIDLRHDYEPSR